MKAFLEGKYDFTTFMPFLVGAALLLIFFLILHRVIRQFVVETEYLETLRSFAIDHGVQKPFSKKMFILMELIGIVFLFFLIFLFFKNPFLSFAVFILFLILSIGLGVKFYVPPSKSFALAENLYYGGEVVSGNYQGRSILIEEEEHAADYFSNSITEKDKRINLKEKLITISLYINNDEVEKIQYVDNKILISPPARGKNHDSAEQMIRKIPVSGKVALYVSQINDRKYISITKKQTGILFVAELYYLSEILRIIAESNHW